MSKSSRRVQPFAHTRLVQFLDKHLESLTGVVCQADIAKALGYTKPNIISMFKTGQTKVPLEKIPDLAEVIRVDPVFLMRLCLEQYWPRRFDVLKPMFANMVTDNERAMVKVCRDVVGDVDYRLPREALDEIKAVINRAVARETRDPWGR